MVDEYTREPGVSPTETERHWAASAHLGALLLALLTSWSAGIAGVLVAGVIYFIKKETSSFVAQHARESLNFNLTMFLLACGLTVAGLVLIGGTVLTLGLGAIIAVPVGLLLAVLAFAVALAWLVCSIMGTINAWHGEAYRYPFAIRLIK